MQHRAVLVCILCVLAVLLTFGITTTLLKKGGEEPAPSVSESVADPTPGEDLSGHYQIDNASTALLTASITTASSPCSSSAPKRASAPRSRSARASLPLRRTPTTTPSLRRWP